MAITQYFEKVAKGIVAAAALGFLVSSIEYTDLPGFGSKMPEAGRTKNSIAAVVGGVIGQKMYGDSSVDLRIKKTFFPDARVTGHTTAKSIDTYVGLVLTSAHFEGKGNPLIGEVHKSEFNWGVEQIAPNRYDIKRFGWKFNAHLNIDVKDGKISGTYIRDGPHFNWKIDGTYDTNGNVNCEIDGHACLGITLEGKVTK